MKIILEEEIKKGSEFLFRAGIKQYRLEAEILLSHILRVSRQKLYIQNEMEIMDAEYTGWMTILSERKKLKPIAYILGRKEFMSMDFFVDENVLIPRPETEFIVEKILKIVKDRKKFPWWIIDLGVGSGNITVSLLNYLPESLVFSTDICGNALTVAKKNAGKYKVENRAVFFQGDWFSPLEGKHLEAKLDFIVSNPPYLTESDMASLPPDVEYEPKIALSGGDKGMEYYDGIINNSLRFLKKEGYLFLEIGIRQKENILDLIKKSKGYSDIEIIKDYAGFDRIVVAKRK